MKILEGKQGIRGGEAEYLTYTHKHCAECSAVKAVDQFYRKHTSTARGWAWDTYCIECRRAACREYGAGSKETRNARLREWRKDNPAKAASLDARRRLKQKYGISADRVEQMRAAQSGQCAICTRATSRLLVDHCHTKGHVRALLCQTCNTFLGWYEKKAGTILRFQRYLEAHRQD